MSVGFKKMKKEKKKKLTYGPNNTSGVVWACFCHCCPSHHMVHRLPLCIYYKHQLASKKMKKENKKSSLMAQTTPDVLFEPVFVAAAPLIAYFVDYIYIYTKH